MRRVSILALILFILSISAQAAVVTDSAVDFSSTQGKNGWYYGYWSPASGKYTFTVLDQIDASGKAWSCKDNSWPLITADMMHPAGYVFNPDVPERHAIRRWVSTVAGKVRVSGHMAMTYGSKGDGTSGHIYLDGKEVFTKALKYNDTAGIDYSIELPVKVGSKIDFAVSPWGALGGDAGLQDFAAGTMWSDSTTFTAVVTTPSGQEVKNEAVKPEDYLASHKISVRQNAGSWVIDGEHRIVTIDSASLAMTVTAGDCKWSMLPAKDSDMMVSADGEKFPLSFTNAGKIELSRYDTGAVTGVKVDLSSFTHNGKPLDIRLQLITAVEVKTGDLVCEVIPTEGSAKIKECRWPKAFTPETIDNTVVPYMQGMLLPKNWPTKVWLYDDYVCYGRGIGMPWFGFTKGDSAALLILETPADGGCHFEHPAGGPTLVEPKWVNSLGRLGYNRRARICFLENGDYVDLAKRYRAYVKESGRFVPLTDKIARKPLLAKLLGSPVWSPNTIAWHAEPQSNYYVKDNPAANDRVASFDERAAEVQKLADLGFKKLYVHQDGIGFRGYDNFNPDVLPPSPKAGGWDGLRRYADLCDKLGFVFAIHDNYRDYYQDSASYSAERATILEDGTQPYEATWPGGPQNLLCASFAPSYVKRNFQEILDHGVELRGAYLDVFSIVSGDECYNPNHPTTREECLKDRTQCFNLISSKVGIVSSEEPTDWAVPYLDLVHHGPYALDPNPGGGVGMGIPVPIFNLVYHDSIFVPWGEGKWGIPTADSEYMHLLLNAGLPYIRWIQPVEGQIPMVRVACGLNKRVGLLEMTKHEFLDAGHRKQRTTFSDGTTVTVDFDTSAYEISPALTEAELNSAMAAD